MDDLRYQIGDKLHCYIYSDYDFEMDVEIQGIGNLEVADREENILRKLFNSETNYQDIVDNTSYFYICKVLTATDNYAVDDVAVLCDSLIKESTYYIEKSLRLILNLSYNTNSTSFRTESEIITAIRGYLNDNGLTNSILKGKTEDELLEDELDELRALVNDIKGLVSVQPIIEQLKAVNEIDIYDKLNTQMIILISLVTNLIKQLRENTSS